MTQARYQETFPRKQRQQGRRRGRLAPLALLGLCAAGMAGSGMLTAHAQEPAPQPVSPVPPVPPVPPVSQGTAPRQKSASRKTAQKPKANSADKPAETGSKPNISLVGANSLPPPPEGEVPPEGAEATNAGQYKAESTPLAERLLGDWGKDLTISGSLSTRFQENSVSGSAIGTNLFTDQQNNNNWDYRNTGPFQQRAEMTITGRVFNAWDVSATLSNARGGTQYNQIFRFNYERQGTQLALGNITESLAGNEFVTFTRNMQGIRVGRDFGRGRIRFKGVASLTRAVTRRGTFRGNGTDGPYLLGISNIVPQSEKIHLNGQQLRPDLDYKIDYYQGSLSFLDGRIVNEVDTIEWTCEAENFNTTPGLLTGMRWDFVDPAGNQHGITLLQQKATGQSSRNGDVVERFPVRIDPGYHYQLSSLIDPDHPVVIRWFNRVLIENVDYVLNRPLRYFQLLTASLPPDTSATGNASLQVSYRPKRQNSLGGDRSVVGVDTQMRLPGNAVMQLHLGQSDGENPQQRGSAMSARASWKSQHRGNRNRWEASLGWRDMDSTFSTIDSVAGSFLQATRGLSTDFAFSPDPRFRFTTGFDQKQVLNQDFSNIGGDARQVWSSTRGMRAGAEVRMSGLPQLDFRHEQTEQAGTGASSRNTFASTSLSANWRAGERLNLRGELRRTASQGRSVFASAYNNSVNSGNGQNGGTIIDQLQDRTGSRSISNTTSNTASFSVGYVPFTWLSLSSSLGLSRTVSGASTGNGSSGTHSTARTLGTSLTMTPFQRFDRNWLQPLSITAGFSESSNGQSTSTFYNPSASGGNTIIPTGVSGQKNRQTNLGLSYTSLNQRLALAFSTTRTLALIPGYDNTQSISNYLSASYQWAPWWSTITSLTNSQMTFVGGQGDSNSYSTTVSNTLGPFNRGLLSRWRFSVDLTRTRYDSATFFSSGVDSPTRQTSTGTTRVSSVVQNGLNTTLGLRTQYEWTKNRLVFLEWSVIDQSAPMISSSGGSGSSSASSNYRQSLGSIGTDFVVARLGQMITSFTVRMNFNSMSDRGGSNTSYRARTLTADLTTRF